MSMTDFGPWQPEATNRVEWQGSRHRERQKRNTPFPSYSSETMAAKDPQKRADQTHVKPHQRINYHLRPIKTLKSANQIFKTINIDQSFTDHLKPRKEYRMDEFFTLDRSHKLSPAREPKRRIPRPKQDSFVSLDGEFSKFSLQKKGRALKYLTPNNSDPGAIFLSIAESRTPPHFKGLILPKISLNMSEQKHR